MCVNDHPLRFRAIKVNVSKSQLSQCILTSYFLSPPYISTVYWFTERPTGALVNLQVVIPKVFMELGHKASCWNNPVTTKLGHSSLVRSLWDCFYIQVWPFLHYFSNIKNCTPVLHTQVGLVALCLVGSFYKSFSYHCLSSLHSACMAQAVNISYSGQLGGSNKNAQAN